MAQGVEESPFLEELQNRGDVALRDVVCGHAGVGLEPEQHTGMKISIPRSIFLYFRHKYGRDLSLRFLPTQPLKDFNICDSHGHFWEALCSACNQILPWFTWMKDKSMEGNQMSATKVVITR